MGDAWYAWGVQTKKQGEIETIQVSRGGGIKDSSMQRWVWYLPGSLPCWQTGNQSKQNIPVYSSVILCFSMVWVMPSYSWVCCPWFINDISMFIAVYAAIHDPFVMAFHTDLFCGLGLAVFCGLGLGNFLWVHQQSGEFPFAAGLIALLMHCLGKLLKPFLERKHKVHSKYTKYITHLPVLVCFDWVQMCFPNWNCGTGISRVGCPADIYPNLSWGCLVSWHGRICKPHQQGSSPFGRS